jgi:hypothetical protein
MAEVKRDVCGVVYDATWTDADGAQHYTRVRAQGSGGNVCMSCDGCYCGEGGDW